MTATSLALCLIGARPAAADDLSVTANEAATALAAVPGLLADSVSVAGSSSVEAVVAGTVEIPRDAAEGVEFGELTIGLPGADDDAPGVRTNTGTVVYPSDGSFATAVQATIDGGARALVVIEGAAAPTEYRFPIIGATRLRADLDGGVSVFNGDVPIARVAPPWAVDAGGNSVPTSFRVDGTVIVQTVRHERSIYPVVADPAFQGDCGWVTCTLRFDRAQTRNARDASWLITGAAGACALFSGPVAIACGVAIVPQAVAIAVFAGRYYEDGDCLQIKFGLAAAGGGGTPGRVARGTRNCQ